MGKLRFKKNADNAAYFLNIETEKDYMSRLAKIAMSMFEWENLPTSMNARFLEECLFLYGSAALLYDESYGFINTKATDAGYINIYGLPTEINCNSLAYSTNRKVYSGLTGNDKKEEECILVMNNWEKIPTASTLRLFAKRLAEAERTIDTNIKTQKFPFLILCDDKQRLTMKNMYAQMDGNEPVIFGDKNIDLQNSVKALNTQAPYLADKLTDYKKSIWNEALLFLGINTLDEKRERLIVGETASNNEVTNLNLQSYLVPRQEACKQFNEKYGLNISVKLRSDLYNVVKENETTFADLIKSEGDSNE